MPPDGGMEEEQVPEIPTYLFSRSGSTYVVSASCILFQAVGIQQGAARNPRWQGDEVLVQ